MVWLKCCPRCIGDLCQGMDLHGYYVACLQCGYHLNEVEEVVLRYVEPPEANVPTPQVQAANAR